MGNEKLTTLARRLRPFFTNQVSSLISGGAVSEGPDIDLVSTSGGVQVGRGGDTIITFDDGGNPVAEYAATSTGFGLALAGGAPVVWLYGYTITGNHTIPAGYHVIGNQRDTSILSGLITLSSGSTLTNLSVIRTANDANALIGVEGPSNGTGYLYGCKVTCTQSGAGAAYAVAANRGNALGQGDMKVYRCELAGTSVSGTGYCGMSSAGKLYIYHGRADTYTTDRFVVA